MPTLKQNLMAEFLGSLFLVVAAIGSTILPMTLPGVTVALAVFINALAVAMVLFALIETFASVSGAHFNPAITLALLATKQISPRKAAFYVASQTVGGLVGLVVVGLMFYDYNSTVLTVSSNGKDFGQVFAEFMGTFILLGVVMGCVRGRSRYTSLSVAFLVGGMLVTTASAMYANPMVSLARVFTYAFCGIAPDWAALFAIAEIAGALFAAYIFAIIFPSKLKDKCDPFECPSRGPTPISMDVEAGTQKYAAFECQGDQSEE